MTGPRANSGAASAKVPSYKPILPLGRTPDNGSPVSAFGSGTCPALVESEGDESPPEYWRRRAPVFLRIRNDVGRQTFVWEGRTNTSTNDAPTPVHTTTTTLQD